MPPGEFAKALVDTARNLRVEDTYHADSGKQVRLYAFTREVRDKASGVDYIVTLRRVRDPEPEGGH